MAGRSLAEAGGGSYIVCYRRAGVSALRRAGEALVYAAAVGAGHSSVDVAGLRRDAGIRRILVHPIRPACTRAAA